MSEIYSTDYNRVTDETDEFGRPWDQNNHVGPVDAKRQPESDYANYVSPDGLNRDEILDVLAGGAGTPGTRLYDIGGPRSGR